MSNLKGELRIEDNHHFVLEAECQDMTLKYRLESIDNEFFEIRTVVDLINHFYSNHNRVNVRFKYKIKSLVILISGVSEYIRLELITKTKDKYDLFMVLKNNYHDGEKLIEELIKIFNLECYEVKYIIMF